MNAGLKAGTFYLIGNLSNKAIALLLIPFLTYNMSTTDYGILNTYLAWSSIFTVFVGLSLGSSFRSAFVDYKNYISSYTSSIFTLSIIIGTLSSLSIFALSFFVDFGMPTFMIALCLLQSFMGFVIDSFIIKYMMEVKYIKRTLLLLLPNLIIALLSIIFILQLSEQKYWGRIIPYVGVYTLFGLFLLFSSFYSGKIYIKLEYWKYSLAFSLPLVFHALSCVILASSDRIMLTNMCSASESGIYSFIYNISLAVKVITSTMESVWIPWFTKKIVENRRNEINSVVKYYIGFVSFIICLLLLVSPEIVKFVAPDVYWSGIPLSIPIIVASFLTFLYSISVDLEYYHKSTKYIAKNTIIAAGLNLLFIIIFIPIYGAVAAAYTTMMAYFVSFVLHYKFAKKLDPELFPLKQYIPSLLVIIITSMSAYFFLEKIYIRWILGAILICSFFIAIFSSSERNILKFIYKKNRIL